MKVISRRTSKKTACVQWRFVVHPLSGAGNEFELGAPEQMAYREAMLWLAKQLTIRHIQAESVEVLG